MKINENGKGKEYYENGKIKFKGEYKNYKRWNGQGFDRNGNILFEIKQGNGKVEEYYDNNDIKFKGEYLNGEKKGKEYYYDGKLKFEGEYLNEQKYKGKLYDEYRKGLIFDGYFLNNMMWNGYKKEYALPDHLIIKYKLNFFLTLLRKISKKIKFIP